MIPYVDEDFDHYLMSQVIIIWKMKNIKFNSKPKQRQIFFNDQLSDMTIPEEAVFPEWFQTMSMLNKVNN